MSNELSIVLDEEKSTPRRKEYLVKRGDDLMYVFKIIKPPKYLEDIGDTYKFEPVLSVGLVPDITLVNGELYISYEQNPLAMTINESRIERFIADTVFAKNVIQYIKQNML